MTHARPLRDADVRRHQRFLEALARDLGEGDDAVQDTWLRVLERGREALSSNRSWLASVLRSRTIDRHRAQSRRRRREIGAARSEALPDSVQPLLDAEQMAELQAGLEGLPKEEREVLEWRYLEQIPAREIARRRGEPVERVYRQLERGRARLREKLGDESRFGALALAPIVATKRAALFAAAALAWKPLALLAVIALVGATWRVIEGPPPDAAPALPLLVKSEESTKQGADAFDPERLATQAGEVRERIVAERDRRGQDPTASPIASLELTVLAGSSGDAAGIQARFVPRSASRALAPDSIDIEPVDIELPRSGRVTVELNPGSAYDLTLRSPLDKGLEPVLERRIAALAPGEVRAWTVEIPAAELRTFAARVIQRESRSPVPAAEALAMNGGSVLARSDASGFVRFDVPREGLGVVRIQAEGFGPALVDTENEGRAEQADFQIELERAASLVVRNWVQFEPEGTPLDSRDAQIEARVFCRADDIARPRGTRLRIEHWRQSPQRDGSDLHFSFLPPGVLLTLEIRRGETLLHRSIEPLILAAGEQRTVDLGREARRYLVGRLQRASGEGLAEREVWLLRASADAIDPWRLLTPGDDPLRRATTDTQGAFEFTEVPEGRWWLGPAPGQDDVAPYARLHLQDSALETRVDLEAMPVIHVRGRVRVPDGREGRLLVFAHRPDVAESVRAPVNESRFEIGPLLPGRWRLHATVGAFQSSRFVYVDVPAELEAEIELVFDDALDILGRVIDGETEAPEKAHVSLVRSGSLSMTTGSDGRFRFEGRKPGTYSLSAQTQDGRVGFLPGIELRAASVEDLVVPVFPSARLQLSVQGEGPSPRCQILAGGDLYQDFTLDRGVTTLQAVPATSIDVSIYSYRDGKRVVHAQRSFLAAPGSTEPMDFLID